MQSKLSISEFTIAWSIWMTEEYDRTGETTLFLTINLFLTDRGTPSPPNSPTSSWRIFTKTSENAYLSDIKLRNSTQKINIEVKLTKIGYLIFLPYIMLKMRLLTITDGWWLLGYYTYQQRKYELNRISHLLGCTNPKWIHRQMTIKLTWPKIR